MNQITIIRSEFRRWPSVQIRVFRIDSACPFYGNSRILNIQIFPSRPQVLFCPIRPSLTCALALLRLRGYYRTSRRSFCTLYLYRSSGTRFDVLPTLHPFAEASYAVIASSVSHISQGQVLADLSGIGTCKPMVSFCQNQEFQTLRTKRCKRAQIFR